VVVEPDGGVESMVRGIVQAAERAGEGTRIKGTTTGIDRNRREARIRADTVDYFSKLASGLARIWTNNVLGLVEILKNQLNCCGA
jgi:hypothetical protein